MKQYPMMETRAGKFAFGVFLFVMLLLARDTLITSCLVGFTKGQVLMAGLIVLAGLVFLGKYRREWKQILTDGRIVLMIVSAAVLLIPMAVKGDWTLMYLSILLCLLFAVFLTYFTTWQEVAKYYVVILTGLSLYSLVAMYVLKGQANSGSIAPSVFVNSAGENFYNFGLAYVVPNPYWRRNFGIFREPGVYQFFLILGLYLNHYGVQWKCQGWMWLVSAVLAVTMLSTFAIGGFIEMGLFALFLFFDRKLYRSIWGKLAAGAILAACLGAVAFILIRIHTTVFEDTIIYEFYDMFLRLTTDSNSLVDRLSAIFTSAGSFFRHPVAGDTIANVLHGTEHNTSSTLILYAVLGFAGGSLNVAAWIALAWKRERCVFGNLVLLVILFMSFNTQNLVADVFFWLFPYMALTQSLLPRMKKL